MHATYCFLVNIDDPAADEVEIAEEAKSAFESRFAERSCDENNWYQQEALVLRDGRVIGLCDGEDWRGRDWLSKKMLEMPQGERWEYARLFSLQCAVNDFELDGRAPMSFGERAPDPEWYNDFEALKQRALEEIPERLSKLWALGPMVEEGVGFNRDSWHREKLSRSFPLFLNSVRYGHAPFSETGPTAYDYRAFDLSYGEGEEQEENKAILFVDIHT